MPAPPKPARATWHFTLASMLDVCLTANAERPFGSRQGHAVGGHRHALKTASAGIAPNTLGTAGTTDFLALKDMTGPGLVVNTTLDQNVMATGDRIAAETRPMNVAYRPRIHA